MFKKKSNLPPRPKYPTTDQIIADLVSAECNDSLFMTSEMILQKKSKMENSQEQDGVFQKLKKLLIMHEDLHGNMENLEILRKKLEDKEEEIVRFSEELKNQALKALV